MELKRILIPGGAGFVGSNLAVRLREAFSGVAVAALDNLSRRGSELNVERLREAGVAFLRGDVRRPDDLEAVGDFDLLIDCAAEPSVRAGMEGSPKHVLDTNLVGTLNCLEAARRRRAAFLLLSTSRVYPVARLRRLPYREEATRLAWVPDDRVPGFSRHGIAEDFPLEGARSFYGASKLAGELVLREYAAGYGMRALANRCAVLSGPWQMGKVDQGVVALWVAGHAFDRPLAYHGFGGSGKQVRDVLHVDDLFDLVALQLASLERWDGSTYNVGGGRDRSVSLAELTALCRSVTGRTVPIGSVPESHEVDVPIFVTDTRKVQRTFGWQPRRTVERVVQDLHAWIEAHRDALRSIFG